MMLFIVALVGEMFSSSWGAEQKINAKRCINATVQPLMGTVMKMMLLFPRTYYLHTMKSENASAVSNSQSLPTQQVLHIEGRAEWGRASRCVIRPAELL